MKLKLLTLILLTTLCFSCNKKAEIYVVGDSMADICEVLAEDGYRMKEFASLKELLDVVPDGAPVMVLANDYPLSGTLIDSADYAVIKQKNLRLFAEFLQWDNTDSLAMPKVMSLERAVITADSISETLPKYALLALNGCYVVPTSAVDSSLVVMAKVAGFDKAEYGLENTPVMPLLYFKDGMMMASTRLSHFAEARYMPNFRVKALMEYVLTWLINAPEMVTIDHWKCNVVPAYQKDEKLAMDARLNSVKEGIEWFYNGHFLVDSSWKSSWADKYMGDGTMPVGPELPKDFPNGDGSLGVLEGHMSGIYWDGSQSYRYWMRDDVQGESAYAFAMAANLLDNNNYEQVASNLIDYSFENYRDGVRNDPNSPSYGLLGWAYTHKGTYYGDDNARSILGTMGAAALMNKDEWNKEIVECIYGNFRTTGQKGFRSGVLYDTDLQKRGWKSFYNDTIYNPHPHFEAWNWACFLWLYKQTGYQPLYDRAVKGIELTMEAYPGKWNWTNGIQQERARMILPLAWLVRVNPSEKHREWLDFMVDELLKNQVECGGIREELGDASTGMFGRTKSNDDYGKHEAPLIFKNGDPICDMLYTTNFAFVGLNECAQATKDPKHIEALQRMSEFLVRIQVRSEVNQSVNGAWFRAFDYECWDYWASNADAGWGAWSTLTGWIQSWIVGTQGLVEKNESLWDIANKLDVKQVGNEVINAMN